jgi:ABC-type nitrate/sulfonate/bicarbonate transport system substrate-binding protein
MTSLIGSRAVGVALVALLCCSAPAEAVDEDAKVLVLAQPLARADAIWMAQSKGFFKAEGLAVSVRWMTAGADMLGVFGQGRDASRGFGDFVVVSDVSALSFWQSVHPDFW